MDFFGFGDWIELEYEVPDHKRGSLKVEHNLEDGFTYGIYDRDLPIYVNPNSGWVCIGIPQSLGKAVEFINNCVAIIDNSQALVALWLKPESLPKL